LCVGGHKREAHPGASNSAASSPLARLAGSSECRSAEILSLDGHTPT
jgi:hypothetical protein